MNEMQSVFQVKTVKNPPLKLDFVEFLDCPVCDFELEVYDQIIEDGSSVSCENCRHKVIFEIVKI